MKKLTTYLFLLLFVATVSEYLTSCSNRSGYLLWDFSSQEIEFAIEDENGYSLVEPTSRQGDLRLKSLTFTWQDKEYRYKGQGIQGLRAIPEFYKGVGIRKDKNRYVLTFGEFQPHYNRSKIKIDIPGVGSHLVEFSYKARTKGRSANIEEALWLDGKPISLSNRGFRVTLVVDRRKWMDYSPKENNRHLPVTLYCFPSNYDHSYLEKAIYVNSFVLYKGTKYPLLKEEKIKGDPIYSEKLLFYAGKDPFLGMNHPINPGPLFIAFGSFDSSINFDKEPIQFTLDDKVYTIEFSLRWDDNGVPIYNAELKGDDSNSNPKKKLYFRNGPLIILPRL